MTLPDFQGQGYGSLLLGELESIIKSKGYTYVILDSSLSAYRLYKRNGYSSIKHQKIMTPKEQLICYNQMRKSL